MLAIKQPKYEKIGCGPGAENVPLVRHMLPGCFLALLCTRKLERFDIFEKAKVFIKLRHALAGRKSRCPIQIDLFVINR
jgi:hypothetical protein